MELLIAEITDKRYQLTSARNIFHMEDPDDRIRADRRILPDDQTQRPHYVQEGKETAKVRTVSTATPSAWLTN